MVISPLGYRVPQVLGRGGIGRPYLAERRDADFDHLVALRAVRTGNPFVAMIDRLPAKRERWLRSAIPMSPTGTPTKARPTPEWSEATAPRSALARAAAVCGHDLGHQIRAVEFVTRTWSSFASWHSATFATASVEPS